MLMTALKVRFKFSEPKSFTCRAITDAATESTQNIMTGERGFMAPPFFFLNESRDNLILSALANIGYQNVCGFAKPEILLLNGVK
jgi:hypothetical protein